MILHFLATLLFFLGLCILFDRHLRSREDAHIRQFNELLTALSTLIPTQTAQVGEAIAKGMGYGQATPIVPRFRIEPNGEVRETEPTKEDEEEPFIPPWDVVVSPEEIKSGGEWR